MVPDEPQPQTRGKTLSLVGFEPVNQRVALPATASLAADHLEGPSDLSEMKAIMAGDHSKAQVVALGTPLAVNPKSSTLLRAAPSPQRDVGFSKRLEKFDQVLD